MKTLMVAAVLLGVAGLARIGVTLAAQQADAGAAGGRVRTYYIAAEKWNGTTRRSASTS